MTNQSNNSRRGRLIAIAAAAAGLAVWLAPVLDAAAIPAFARKYNLTCSSCHTAPPYLNSTGRAFKEGGYRMPDEDGEIDIEEQDYQKISDALYLEKVFPLSVRAAARPYVVAGELGHKPERQLGSLGDLMLLTAGNFHAYGSFFGEAEIATSGGAEANGFVAFHPAREANIYVGYGTPFRNDPYNSLKGGHGFTLSPRVALMTENGLGESLQSVGTFLAVSGRTSRVYYSAGLVRHDHHEEAPAAEAAVIPYSARLGGGDLRSAGHGGAAEGTDPHDFTARVAVDIDDTLSVGTFGWLGLNREDEDTGDEGEFLKAGADVNLDRDELHFQGLFVIDRTKLTPAGGSSAATTELAAHGELFYTFRTGGRPLWMPLLRVDYNTVNDRADTRLAIVGQLSSYIYENARVGVEVGSEVVTASEDGDRAMVAGVNGDVVF